MDRTSRVRRLAAALLLVLLLPACAQAQTGPARAVDFGDTLFMAVDAAWRAAFDEEGDVWYSTEGGLVHVDPATRTREVFTAAEGLPSSYSFGLAMRGAKVYVGTDGGVGVVDRLTGDVQSFLPGDGALPSVSVQEVAVDGDDLWTGTFASGVARLNLTSGEWTLKNTSTTPGMPSAIRRIVPGPSAVWIATQSDGLWRLDRASGQWRVLLPEDGLASRTVLSVLEWRGEAWIGTDKGLQRWDLATARALAPPQGLPSPRVLDLDLVPNEADELDVWAATPRGLWQHDPRTGLNTSWPPEALGYLGEYVLSHEWSEAHGWLVATERGVNHFYDGGWRRYATNPGAGPGSGPYTSRFLSAGAGDSGPYLWFGTDDGIMAYQRPSLRTPGAWYNLGPAQHYPGGAVYALDTEGNTTWLATSTGTYGYNRASNQWVSRIIEGTRNLVYGIDADQGELWIAFFGEGLLAQDLGSGRTRTWDYQTPISIPDINLLDVRVQGDDVWIACARGLMRLDRVTGTVTGFWTVAHGIPGGTVYRVLPDRNVVWLGTQDGGVARFDVQQGRVTQVWNGTTTPGFTHPDVRALHREGDHLWAGTLSGLWRLHVPTGAQRVFNHSNSGLVQDFVQGITSADGLLYLATFSGVARMDLATGEFLPMRDGPGVVRGSPPADPVPDPARVPGAAGVSVRIDSPREGAAVAGVVTLKGSAFRLGGRVERVEVQAGNGSWQPAEGAETWQHRWDSTAHPPYEPVTLRVRAFSGNETSRIAEVTLTPYPAPTTPLLVEDVSPDEATAGRPFRVLARVEGDAPLSATLHYKASPDAPLWTPVAMTRQGGFHAADVPARDVRQGTLLYYVEARSGALSLTDPEDPARPRSVTVLPPPSVAVDLAGPASATARAGQEIRLPLRLENVGTEAVSVEVRASGLRAAWVRLETPLVTLAPGANATLEAILSVPDQAFADQTSLTFEARVEGVAGPVATRQVPLEILGGPAEPTAATGSGGGRIPTPLALVPLAALLAALLAGRRR